MANILCLETATTNCSVALSVQGRVVALREDKSKGYSHAERLHVFINEVLEESDLQKEELDGIAVSKGPGSYTGLRIGVSAAKGLCYALDIPLISISTLMILAAQVEDYTTIIPMLDARRMEAYTAVFNSKLKQIRQTEAEIIDEHSFVNYLDRGSCLFIGSGAEKFQDICGHENANFKIDALPSSAEMVKLAEEKYTARDFEDVAYFEPYYLKDFVKG